MSRKRQAFYTKAELERILNLNEKEHRIFMLNEIFGDLNDALHDEDGNKIEECRSTTHIAYAYSYYYLANYMWRYGKFYIGDGFDAIDEKIMKQILGFPKNNKSLNYLTKRNGVLVNMGYVEKVTDKPVGYIYVDTVVRDGKLKKEIDDFIMESEYPEIYGNKKASKANFPIKAYFRDEYAKEDNYYNGTFWEIENTHHIDIDIFIYCMSEPELGVEGFYLYSFLKMATDKFERGFDCSYKRMARLTGLSIDEVKLQLVNLEKRNMIKNDHKPFCMDKPVDKQTKVNTYKVLNHVLFAENEREYNVIPKQRKIPADVYEVEIGWAGENHYKDGSVRDSDTSIDGQEPFETAV
ncbi:hypothetical protein [Oceanobacillus sp. FSL K6-0127]|uniref:hypothetical protein n=1 Tax=Oceanobacillus sp. FSL K6-0127 TaxID=2921420 RepID=UPI0030ED0735